MFESVFAEQMAANVLSEGDAIDKEIDSKKVIKDNLKKAASEVIIGCKSFQYLTSLVPVI